MTISTASLPSPPTEPKGVRYPRHLKFSTKCQRGLTPKEGFVRRLFDAISPRYDRFNRWASLGLDQGWRRKAVASLQLLPGERVLDLASGTGDLAVEAAKRLVPLGEVIACDLSDPMLHWARTKFQQIPFAPWHIRLIQGRAEELPFPDGSFHAATIGFALRNVSDLGATFQELHRVLKPGGRIALLEFGRPANPLLRLGHRLWLSLGVPLIGLFATWRLWPFLYLRHSVLEFMPSAEVLQRLKKAGFNQTAAKPFTGGAVLLYQAVRSY